MKILVTGALGFVGTNLCKHFSSQSGIEIVGIDNWSKSLGSNNNNEMLKEQGVEVEYCDIRNSNDVEKIFQKHQSFDVIFHMAAQVAFKCSMENPRLDFEINVLATFNLLEATRLLSPSAIFVYASTNQVYGELKGEPIKEYETRYDFVELHNGVPETHALDFLSPYGCSKGAGDMYVYDYARVFGLSTVVTRFGGIYGEYQYSYEDHGWISYITEQVLNDQEFNRFGHGKQVRDVLHISDIVNAMSLIVENIDKVTGEVLNIGGGKDNTLSVLELLTLLEEFTGNEEKSIVMPMRQADKVVMYLDIEKAARLLGWSPKIGAREGISRLIKWQKTR